MSEDVIRQEGGDLPICVIRPSMIVPSWKEPVPVGDKVLKMF